MAFSLSGKVPDIIEDPTLRKLISNYRSSSFEDETDNFLSIAEYLAEMIRKQSPYLMQLKETEETKKEKVIGYIYDRLLIPMTYLPTNKSTLIHIPTLIKLFLKALDFPFVTLKCIQLCVWVLNKFPDNLFAFAESRKLLVYNTYHPHYAGQFDVDRFVEVFDLITDEEDFMYKFPRPGTVDYPKGYDTVRGHYFSRKLYEKYGSLCYVFVYLVAVDIYGQGHDTYHLLNQLTFEHERIYVPDKATVEFQTIQNTIQGAPTLVNMVLPGYPELYKEFRTRPLAYLGLFISKEDFKKLMICLRDRILTFYQRGDYVKATILLECARREIGRLYSSHESEFERMVLNPLQEVNARFNLAMKKDNGTQHVLARLPEFFKHNESS